MPTIKTQYLGQLRTQSLHVKSNNTIITDAPIDNQGKGEAFSPTDLLATSLASCMLTIMGIKANSLNVSMDGTSCIITKLMSPSPRKISEIIIEINFKGNFTELQKDELKIAAHSCPVALSLHPDLKQTVIFNF